MVDARSQRGTPLGTRYVERFLRRLFNTQGPVVTDHLRGDVAPSIDVRPIHPWEFRDFGIMPWGQMATASAVAGEHSYVEVQEYPNAPGYDVVLTAIRVSAAANVRVQAASIGDLAGLSGASRDTGLLPFGTPVSLAAWIVAATAVAGAFGGVIVGDLSAGETFREPIIIRDGSPGVVVVNHALVNTALTVTVNGFLVPISVADI